MIETVDLSREKVKVRPQKLWRQVKYRGDPPKGGWVNRAAGCFDRGAHPGWGETGGAEVEAKLARCGPR